MATPRIYADFHNLDDHNRLRLTCAGTLEDLKREGIQLREGLALTFYTDDADDQGQPDELRVDGVVHYDTESQCWVGAVDWHALRHASDEQLRNGAHEADAPENQSSAEHRRASHGT
jgi:hypothetical protein